MCASQKSELYENLKSEIMLFELFITFFDFRFSLILADEVTKIPEYYVICLFTSFKSLACLANGNHHNKNHAT